MVDEMESRWEYQHIEGVPISVTGIAERYDYIAVEFGVGPEERCRTKA